MAIRYVVGVVGTVCLVVVAACSPPPSGTRTLSDVGALDSAEGRDVGALDSAEGRDVGALDSAEGRDVGALDSAAGRDVGALDSAEEQNDSLGGDGSGDGVTSVPVGAPSAVPDQSDAPAAGRESPSATDAPVTTTEPVLPVVPPVTTTTAPTSTLSGPAHQLAATGAGNDGNGANLAAPLAAARVSPLTIERGHLDLVEVTVAGGRIVLSVKDHTTPGGPTFRAPADLQVRVRDAARTTIPPGSAFAFLGRPGGSIHLLPQTEDSSLVWPGWSTERLPSGKVRGDIVTWRLRSVKGPGAVAVFTTDQFGVPSVIFDSDGGGRNETTVRINTHAHANWAFAAPGAYQLTFEVAADLVGGGPTATTATYVVLVGDATAPVPPVSIPPAQQGVPPSSPSVGSTASPAAPPASVGSPSPGSPSTDVAGITAGSGPSEPNAAAAGSSGGASSAPAGVSRLPLTGSASIVIGGAGLLSVVVGLVVMTLVARLSERRCPRAAES